LAGNGLLGTLVAVELSSRGVAPQLTGLVMGAYFVGFGVGSLRADRVIVRIGPIRAFAAFGAALAASALALALHVSPLGWLLLRLVGGVCAAGFFLVVEGWLHAVAAPESRGRVLSAYMITVYLSLAGGQALFAARAAIGPGAEIFVLCGLLISLAIVPVALTRSAAPEISASRAAPLSEILRRCPLGLASGLGGGLLAGSFYGMGPVFALDTALPLGGVAPFMTVTLLGALLFQAPVGRLSDRVDRRRVIAGAAFAVVAVALAMPTLGALSQPVALALAALFGGAILTIYPLGLAHLFDRLDRDTALAGLRTLLFAYAVGSSLGPLLAALTMRALGSEGLFTFNGVVALALGAYAVVRVRRVPPVPVEEQEAFVAAPRSTPVLAELDPRASSPGDPSTTP
jgi:MFS family permease